MFTLLGFAPIAALVSESQLYAAILVGGAYQISHRISLTIWFVQCYKIKALQHNLFSPFASHFALYSINHLLINAIPKPAFPVATIAV